MDVSRLRCRNCGASQPEPLDTSLGYPNCNRCGARWWRIDVTITECANASNVVLGTLTPGGDTARDWNSQWQSIQAELKSLSESSMETMSRDAIFAWRDRLCNWYVLAYHLKDALKHAASTLGINRQAIETAITSDRGWPFWPIWRTTRSIRSSIGHGAGMRRKSERHPGPMFCRAVGF